MFSINGKKVLINGGTAGIGLAVATHFVLQGAQVVIVGRRDATDTAAAIGCRSLQADLSQEAAVIDTLQRANSLLGGFDVVINNAGLENTGPTISEATSEELQRAFSLNSHSLYWSLQYAPRYMVNGGAIINTASAAAFVPAPGYSQYGATKATVVYYTRAAALELAPSKIRVNAICPGSIETTMLPPGHPERALVECMAPLKRVGSTDDLLGFYQLLASDASSYMTGQSLLVDGGISAGIGYGVLEKIAT